MPNLSDDDDMPDLVDENGNVVGGRAPSSPPAVEALAVYMPTTGQRLRVGSSTGGNEVDIDDVCGICHDEYNVEDEVTRIVSCGHFFHAGCVEPVSFRTLSS